MGVQDRTLKLSVYAIYSHLKKKKKKKVTHQDTFKNLFFFKEIKTFDFS